MAIVTVLLGAMFGSGIANASPAMAQAAPVHLPPQASTDCDGDIPVVVASDAAAQSDIYSAVTLAGVLGTDCIILAGPRTGPMPAAQRTRLDAAAEGGYIVGGEAAVPAHKTAGRDMARISGAHRWETAQLIGDFSRRGGAPSGTFVAVTAGDRHTCGLRSNGYVECWGDNSVNQHYEPYQQEFAAVSAGGDATCGLRTDAAIECWGLTGSARIVEYAPSGAFASVAVGSGHACAVRTDQSIVCWGRNTEGELNAPSGQFVAVTAGRSHSCALQVDGTVECWGENEHGESNAPDGRFTQIDAGFHGTCGIRRDATLSCWGRTVGGSPPQPPAGQFESVSVGTWYACGVRVGGAIQCWGHNRDGQGDAPIGQFSDVSAGASHTCGLRSDSTVECWGKNRDAQLQRSEPPRFSAISMGQRLFGCGIRIDGTVQCWHWGQVLHDLTDTPKGTFTDIASGLDHACAIRTDGTVSCWGSNIASCSEARDGTLNCKEGGQIEPPSGKFVSVTAGIRHSCGLRPDASVECWGGADGAAAAAPGSFTQISAGWDYTCGLRPDQTIECWVIDRQGQDKDRSRVATTMVDDSPEGKFTSVDAGFEIACAIRVDNALVCWGFANSVYPHPTGSFSSVEVGGVGRCAGVPYACALRMDGTPLCWAYSTNGSADHRPYSFDTVSTGGTTSCGLRSDGTIECWGDGRVGPK